MTIHIKLLVNSKMVLGRNGGKRWNQEPRHMLATLYSIKKMENETMDEFNTKFRRVVASILISYIEAFTGDLRYQLRDKEIADLKTA